MTTKTRFKSDAFEAIHSAARGLHRAGTIDKATLRDFDETCLTALAAIAPEDIKRIREGAHVSQPVFARYLNTSESTVQKWEAGTKRPSGMALKLLAVVEKHGLKVLT
jgi:putative transcriptional regulator